MYPMLRSMCFHKPLHQILISALRMCARKSFFARPSCFITAEASLLLSVLVSTVEIEVKEVIQMAKRARRGATKDLVTPQTKKRKLVQKENDLENTNTIVENDIEELKEEEEYDIEKIRLKNLQENAAFLQDLGLNKEILNFSLNKPKSRPSQNGLKEKRERVILPPRKSLRLQRMDPKGESLPELPQTPLLNDTDGDNPRLPEGPLAMAEHVSNDFEEKDKVCEIFHKKVAKLKPAKNKKTADSQSFLNAVLKMTINEDRVAKVVPQRIFSVAVHPDDSCTLAVAGDKWGRVGFWEVGSKAGQDGVICYRPHSRPVSCLSFKPTNPRIMYSCSYDGTLRSADFEKGVFDDVYATKEEHDERLTSFAFAPSDSLLVTNSYGEVAHIDSRSNANGAESLWRVDDRLLKCVSVHPTDDHYFVTASNSGVVQIFDLRNMGKKPKPVKKCHHSKSVDSAYFSPVTGKYILTTCMDNRIRILDSSMLIKNGDTNGEIGNCLRAVAHDNHTGRWLSNFRPVWHPQREDFFVVGSMARPRRIELFDENCKIVTTFEDNMENLASVCSLNAFHPTRNVLVGGNSSGRLHIFSDS